VLDRVERGRLLVEPAGEGPAEAAVSLAHVELDEGAGQHLLLPRRRRLAGAQADDDVADPHGMAGLELDVARDAVALVEQPQHSHPIRHWGRPGSNRRHRLRLVDRHRLRVVLAGVAGARTTVAAGERDEAGHEQDDATRDWAHSCPGVQAW
jgi:hypothetical protein